jgi:hypothetical protein
MYVWVSPVVSFPHVSPPKPFKRDTTKINLKKSAGCLNFNAWLMKNLTTLWIKQAIIIKEQYFVENKTEIRQHVLKIN